MLSVFKEEHVGQDVNCLAYGNGVIVVVTPDTERCVVRLTCGYEIAYIVDGSLTSIAGPTLRFGHREEEVFNYGTPVKAKKLKFEGTPVLAYVADTSLESALVDKHKRLVIAKSEDRYLAIECGLSNTVSCACAEWKYAVEIHKE